MQAEMKASGAREGGVIPIQVARDPPLEESPERLDEGEGVALEPNESAEGGRLVKKGMNLERSQALVHRLEHGGAGTHRFKASSVAPSFGP